MMGDYLAFNCGYCGAGINQHCVSRSGRRCSAHLDRQLQENAAWKRDHRNRLEDAARGRF